MKKLYKLSLLVLIPIIVGLALQFIGHSNGNQSLKYIGVLVLEIGIPITMVVLVVVGLVLMITGRANDSNASTDDMCAKPNDPNTRSEDIGAHSDDGSAYKSQPFGEREREEQELSDINSTYRSENRMRQADYYGRHLSEVYKHSTPKEKILGWLFFGFLIADFMLIIVFAFFHNMTGVIVCFSIFGGTILITIIVKVILEKASMRAKYRRGSGQEILEGEVEMCALSSSTSVGGGSHSRTSRIVSVVYRVTIYYEDESYTAYSKNFYETGSRVKFFVIGRHRASIIDAKDVDAFDNEF